MSDHLHQSKTILRLTAIITLSLFSQLMTGAADAKFSVVTGISSICKLIIMSDTDTGSIRISRVSDINESNTLGSDNSKSSKVTTVINDGSSYLYFSVIYFKADDQKLHKKGWYKLQPHTSIEIPYGVYYIYAYERESGGTRNVLSNKKHQFAIPPYDKGDFDEVALKNDISGFRFRGFKKMFKGKAIPSKKPLKNTIKASYQTILEDKEFAEKMDRLSEFTQTAIKAVGDQLEKDEEEMKKIYEEKFKQEAEAKKRLDEFLKKEEEERKKAAEKYRQAEEKKALEEANIQADKSVITEGNANKNNLREQRKRKEREIKKRDDIERWERYQHKLKKKRKNDAEIKKKLDEAQNSKVLFSGSKKYKSKDKDFWFVVGYSLYGSGRLYIWAKLTSLAWFTGYRGELIIKIYGENGAQLRRIYKQGLKVENWSRKEYRWEEKLSKDEVLQVKSVKIYLCRTG